MKKGDKLVFNTYGYIIEGQFVEKDGDVFVVQITEDFIKEHIGTNQRIHSDFLVKRSHNN